MLRLLVAAIFIIFGVILCMPYHLYLKSVAKKDTYKGWTKSWRFVRKVFRGMLKIAGTDIELRGLENLDKVPKEQGILFVGNHRSYFDILTLQTVVDRPMGFIAKKELKKVPLFWRWMDDIGCLFLDRANVRASMETINTGIEYMKQGLSLGLFPEGTRNHGSELKAFKPGGYRMAEKSNSAIIPVALTGLDNILENNKPIALKKCHVVIEFGEPTYPHELENKARKEYYSSIPTTIQTMLDSHNNN